MLDRLHHGYQAQLEIAESGGGCDLGHRHFYDLEILEVPFGLLGSFDDSVFLSHKLV